MRRFGRYSVSVMGVVLGLMLVSGTALAAGGGDWPFAGGDLQNTRYQDAEHKISPANVGTLAPKWTFTTGGDVSATPAVDDAKVYVPDWAGNLYAIDRKTGQQVWKVSIAAVTGVPGDKARTTPALAGDKVIIGTQGTVLAPSGGAGGWVLAFNKNTGALLWQTKADDHQAAVITQSATVFGNRVYVGVSSMEEALAAFQPGYQLSFRGSMLALDLNTGAIVWKTYMVPTGYTGAAVWGSSPAIDPKRGQLYIATGNNYSAPQSVLDCVTAAGTDPNAIKLCVPAEDHFDSVLALDLKTGAIRWSYRAIPYDTWTAACIFGGVCPNPAGPDFDFGQAPALFTVKDGGKGNPHDLVGAGQKDGGKGKPRDLVGAGQKSGQYWALDPDTGALQWVTQAGPGGVSGGLQWGSAVDGQRIYTANANSNHLPWPPSGTDTSGVWSALDAATGAVLWQTRPPDGDYAGSLGGTTSGPVTTANGVVFGCSLKPDGHMYALNAATGVVLWDFTSGGSCVSGAAISNGMVFWGSGYSNFGMGTSNNKVYAFSLRGR